MQSRPLLLWSLKSAGVTMPLDRSKLPTPEEYFSQFGGKPLGKSIRLKCPIHRGNGSTLSVDKQTGRFHCFSCGAHGGDVLDFVMQLHKVGFIHAASHFGAWVADGKGPTKDETRARVDYRSALMVLDHEAQILALVASDIRSGKTVTDADVNRLLVAAGRVVGVHNRVYA